MSGSAGRPGRGAKGHPSVQAETGLLLAVPRLCRQPLPVYNAAQSTSGPGVGGTRGSREEAPSPREPARDSGVSPKQRGRRGLGPRAQDGAATGAGRGCCGHPWPRLPRPGPAPISSPDQATGPRFPDLKNKPGSLWPPGGPGLTLREPSSPEPTGSLGLACQGQSLQPPASPRLWRRAQA